MALLKRPRVIAGGGLKKPLAKPGLSKPGKVSSPTSGPKKKSISKDGSFARMQQEKEAWENRAKEPWRLSIPIGGKIVGYFLDDDEPWSRYEHKIGGGPNSRAKPFPCIKDTNEACPLCASEGKEGNHTLFLTIIVPVLKYKNKDGEQVTQRYAKRLVPIGMKMAGKYQRLYEKHGTFRGMKVTLIRDSKMDPGSGNDIEFEEMLSEATIKSLAKKGVAAVTEYAQKNRKDIKDLDTDFLQPFDYDEVMPTPNAKDLAKMAKVGLRRGVGSEDLDDESDFSGDDDGGGWGDDD